MTICFTFGITAACVHRLGESSDDGVDDASVISPLELEIMSPTTRLSLNDNMASYASV